jgi:hypothetical protein
MRIFRLESMRLNEPSPHCVEVGLGRTRSQRGEIRVVLQPVVQMLDCLSLFEFIGAGDAQAKD